MRSERKPCSQTVKGRCPRGGVWVGRHRRAGSMAITPFGLHFFSPKSPSCDFRGSFVVLLSGYSPFQFCFVFSLE